MVQIRPGNGAKAGAKFRVTRGIQGAFRLSGLVQQGLTAHSQSRTVCLVINFYFCIM
jgi:hypothetical protein